MTYLKISSALYPSYIFHILYIMHYNFLKFIRKNVLLMNTILDTFFHIILPPSLSLSLCLSTSIYHLDHLEWSGCLVSSSSAGHSICFIPICSHHSPSRCSKYLYQTIFPHNGGLPNGLFYLYGYLSITAWVHRLSVNFAT